MPTPEEVLKKYWGFDSFRPVQQEAIASVLGGRDTLVLMPTGGGKSLLYQIPGMVLEGICIVVTPLIALMKDQVDRLRKMGIAAQAVHSGLSSRQIDILLDNCVYGQVKFLYIAPERISTEIFKMRARRMNISLVAVDEAHCISQWGYDFRPSYLKIAELRTLAPDAPVLALTASATGDVADDITKKLEFRDGIVMRSDFERPTLSYSVRQTEDKQGQMLRIINNVAGQGIIYVRTREATEQIAELLRDHGVSAESYHGGLGSAERALRQDMWMTGKCRIMVSTNAFGMGIDKAGVRTVIHYDICDSIEEYYQEAGRAGRDGRRAYAVLLLGSGDKARAMRRFASEFPSLEMIRECYEAIFNYLQIGIGDGKYASFEFNLFEFSRRAKYFTTAAHNAIRILEANGYLQLTEPADLPARIMFTVSRDDLYKVRIEREEFDHILRIILRLYDGVFHNFVAIDEVQIAAVSGYTVEKVKELLSRLWNLRTIRYIPAGNSPLLIVQQERLPTKDVYISPMSYDHRKRAAAARLEAVFAYAQDFTQCRSAALQRYFGQEDARDCGICDNCLLRKKRGADGKEEALREKIMSRLGQGSADIKELIAELKTDPARAIAILDTMQASGDISAAADGKLAIKR